MGQNVSDTSRARRSPVFLSAVVEADGVSIPVRIRNISEGGVLVEGDSAFGKGRPVTFRRGSLMAQGSIAWANGCFAGIEFNERLEPTDLFRHIGRPQNPARDPSDLFRRPGVRPRRLTLAEQNWVELLNGSMPRD